MKVQELIDAVNNSEESIYSLWQLEDVIPDLPECVAEGLELDEHRWYSVAVNVYKCEDGFVGVWGTYQSFSEMQGWSDIDILCEAEEYKQVPSVTYVPKREGEI